MLLQHDLVPGLDKVDMLSAGVVSCKMTQRGSTLADAVLPCILTQLICVLRYSGSSTGYLPPKGHKKGLVMLNALHELLMARLGLKLRIFLSIE